MKTLFLYKLFICITVEAIFKWDGSCPQTEIHLEIVKFRCYFSARLLLFEYGLLLKSVNFIGHSSLCDMMSQFSIKTKWQFWCIFSEFLCYFEWVFQCNGEHNNNKE